MQTLGEAVFVTLTLHCVMVMGFNIDTTNVHEMRGREDTQFGYSLRFLPPLSSRDNPRLMVGAPLAKSAGNVKSGIVHMCQGVVTGQSDCSNTLYVDDRGQAGSNATVGERFGSTLAVYGDKEVMICSPNWKLTKNPDKYFLPGRCAKYNLETQAKSSIEKYLWRNRTVEVDGRHYLFKGLASFGFSLDTHESLFVVGLPGIYNSQGALRVEKLGYDFADTTPRKPIALNLFTTAYGYEGYSIKFGNFCGSRQICIGTGAPNMGRTGTVFIYEFDSTRFRISRLNLLTGSQVWSFFGSSLASVDVNGDGIEELLVGAPHYTDLTDTLLGFDQGRAYVYSWAEGTSLGSMSLKAVLDGNQAVYGRFGFAIQTMGDINLDGFKDIVIGAPGEDSGQGCVYVYLGGKGGLDTKYSQRISPAQSPGISSPVRGLGFAFSDSMTPRGERYPVLAVSAVDSDSVFVLQCRPVVDLDVELTATPNPVDLEQECSTTTSIKSAACFEIQVCLTASVRGVATQPRGPMDFLLRTDIDTQKSSTQSKRAMLQTNVGVLVDQVNVTVPSGECQTFLALVRESQVNQDRYTPIEIVVNYKLKQERPYVLDATKPHHQSLTVTFQNECGDDSVCEADLDLGGRLTLIPRDSTAFIVLNKTRELQVHLHVKNLGETSDWTVVTVELSQDLTYVRARSDSLINCKRDTSSSGPGGTEPGQTGTDDAVGTLVVCNYYKPLDTNKDFNVTLVFDTQYFDRLERQLKVKANTWPHNREHNPEKDDSNNQLTQTADIRIDANVVLEGSSSPKEHTVHKAKRIDVTEYNPGQYRISSRPAKPFNLTHKILARNNGPSFLPPTSIEISVPVYLLDGTKLVTEALVKMVTPDGLEVMCTGKRSFSELGPTQTTTASSSRHSTTTTSSSDSSSNTGQGTQTWTSRKTTQGKPPTTTTTSTTTEDYEDIINRKRREAPNNDHEADDDNVRELIYVLGCDDDNDDAFNCQIYSCRLETSMPSGSHAEITLDLVLDQHNIPIPPDFNTLWFISTAQILEPQNSLFLPWDQVPSQNTLTKFRLVASQGGKVNIWILVGSVIAGLVLITIIVLILWKLGFFRRKKHHQVEKWRRESQRRSRRIPSSSAAGGGPCADLGATDDAAADAGDGGAANGDAADGGAAAGASGDGSGPVPEKT